MRIYSFDFAVCLSKENGEDTKVEFSDNAQMKNYVGGRLFCFILSNNRFKRGAYTRPVSDTHIKTAHIHVYSADRQKTSSTAGMGAVKGYSGKLHDLQNLAQETKYCYCEVDQT